jgi:hypothetical protein
MDDPGTIAAWGLAFRIGERLLISAVVILVCLVVTVGFWRSIQKLDFTFSQDKISGAANVVLATPVFALLALILFAWVSFSHPVAVTVPGAAAGEAGDKTAAADAGGVQYVGAVPGVATGGDLSFERRRAEDMVRSLNCVAIAAGPAVSPREADALAEARLAALLPVWPEEWGDQPAFRAWALGRSTAEPDPEAKAAFEAAHPEC